MCCQCGMRPRQSDSLLCFGCFSHYQQDYQAVLRANRITGKDLKAAAEMEAEERRAEAREDERVRQIAARVARRVRAEMEAEAE